MRYVLATILALLGVGVIPLNPRNLFTGPGLIFATLGILLIFFAYRIVTHKNGKKPEL